MKKKIISIAFVAVLALVLFVGCGNDKNTQDVSGQKSTEATKTVDTKATDQEELIFVEREIASKTDPNFYPGSSHYLANGASETLFKIQANGEVEPFLAKGSKQIDETTWKIDLRPEAKFWSGESITAQAVIDSLERSRETNVRALPFLEGISFTPIDDYSFEAKTERKNLNLPLSLAYMELSIINASKAHDSIETMDMSGMYKVVEFQPKKKIVLEINENYYGKKPTIKRIIHEEIMDNEARTLAASSGRADIVRGIPNESIAQLKKDDNLVLHMAPAANTQTIYLNLQKEHLKDVKVRQALAWALDRDELVVLGSEGLSTPVTTWLGSNPKYAEAKNAVYTKYDPDKAKDLLEEAGWKLGDDGIRHKNGEKLQFKLRTWGQDKALGETIQNQWSRIGVDTEVIYGDYALIETARETGDWDGLIEAWQTYGDEHSLLSGQFNPTGTANYGKYDDVETNKLLEKLLNAKTAEERHELALAINERIAMEVPAIYMYPRVETSAVKKSLKGYKEHFRQFENVVNSDLEFEGY